jgi:hypothetical protein
MSHHPIGGENETTGRHSEPTPVYVIKVTPLPGNWRTSGVLRLRGLLKAAKRAYGLRCIECYPVAPPAVTPPHRDGEATPTLQKAIK